MINKLSKYFNLFQLLRRVGNQNIYPESIFYHDFRNLPDPVERTSFLLEITKGKRVLHFGFLDTPFLKEKLTQEALLHQKFAKVSSFLYGIDIEENDIAEYRRITNDNNNALFDIQSNLPLPDFLSQKFDIIILGEVLEHLPHPFKALEVLNVICKMNEGCQLCVTVPNAMSAVGFSAAFRGIELVHPDHYFYFSPYTLRNLLLATGFHEITIRLYAPLDWGKSIGITQHGVIALCNP